MELIFEQKAPDEFVEDLKEAIFKYKIVMRLDVSKCHHVQDKQPVEIIPLEKITQIVVIVIIL